MNPRTQELKNMEEGERNRILSKGFIKVYRKSVTLLILFL